MSFSIPPKTIHSDKHEVSVFMFVSKLQSIIRQAVSLFILTSLLSAPSTMVWAISPPPHNTTNPYQWFSMEEVLQKAELSRLTEIEIDQLGFAEFCQRHQIAGSFAERKAQLKAKVINLQHELNTHPVLKQPATGAIA
ncbi:MAG TPA: hypothetical protein PKE58_24885, partial [Acidobacteriota bacterium]|nr:hypothetical protein [Acidobacteriota bacterium]